MKRNAQQLMIIACGEICCITTSCCICYRRRQHYCCQVYTDTRVQTVCTNMESAAFATLKELYSSHGRALDMRKMFAEDKERVSKFT